MNGSTREVELWVSDFSTVSQQYYRVWSSLLLSNGYAPPSLDLADITGNQKKEILVFGTTNLGLQALDVFSLTTGSSFSKIFSNAVRGTIQVEQKQRSLAYSSGQTFGASFDILVEENRSSDPQDLTLSRTKYQFSLQDNTYIRGDTQVLEPLGNPDDELLEAIEGGEEALFRYIQGPWFLTERTETPLLIVFNPFEDEVVIVDGANQEHYNISRALRTYRTGLQFWMENDISPSNKFSFALSLTGPEEMRITPWEPFHISGSFQRLSDSAKMGLVARSPSPILPFQPRGVYRNELGHELTFSLPEFVYKSGDQPYKLEFLEERTDNRNIRSLHLIPGKVGIRGFEPGAEPPTHFEQVEFLSGD